MGRYFFIYLVYHLSRACEQFRGEPSFLKWNKEKSRSVGSNENSIATPSILGFYWISKIKKIQMKQTSFHLLKLLFILCIPFLLLKRSLMILLDFSSNRILINWLSKPWPAIRRLKSKIIIDLKKENDS